jgi:phosphatidylethanolamine/phosphatidyl-N-methylethanolamine N-methyltransferase
MVLVLYRNLERRTGRGANQRSARRLHKRRALLAFAMNFQMSNGLTFQFDNHNQRPMNPISVDNVVSAYRFYAPHYDRLFGAVLEPGRRALTQAVCAVRPASILEVGVGTGLTLSRYPAGSAVVGIDISDEMLDIARERAAKLAGRNIHLAAMNAEAMDFPDACFDCVAIPYVLSVTPHPERLVAEIRRVCRKGGTILILNHFSGSRFWWFLERAVRKLSNKIGFRSDFCYDEQILKYNWEILSVKKVNFLGLSRLVVIRNS